MSTSKDAPGRLCVVTVVLLTLALTGNSATPETRKGHDAEGVGTTDAPSKKVEVVSSNGKRSNGPNSAKTPLTFDCIEEDTQCNKDKFGYEAIAHLHRLIDDDHNGNVDQSESDEFLRDELQYTDGFERHSLFHNNDKLISVDDLWRAWKFSAVYNWTVDDVVDWLQKEVDLPQYCSIFIDNSVSGPFLPRLASSNTFLSAVLGIRNPVHKQKLVLKAMDTVLFGAPPPRHNYIKDVVLMASVIFAVGGCWFAYLHHRYSQAQVRKMMIDLESLQKAEDALMDVQRKLEDAENRQVSALLQRPADYQDGTAVSEANLPGHNSAAGTQQIEAELAATLLALQHAETRLENSWAPPGELQAWLQLTHELEQVHYVAKRQAAERQFQSAKEVCDKIKKRNKAFFGSMRMAHSNSLDEIDQRILDARLALEEVKQDLQERLQRWHTIERMCGFPIISNPGSSTLRQMVYGSKEGPGNGGRLATGSAVNSSSVEETDEDLRPSELDDLTPLPYTLFPEMKHVDKDRQGTQRRVFRRQRRLSYPNLPHAVPSKPFIRQRAITGSTGSLSNVSRNAVNTNAVYGTSQPHPAVSGVTRGSRDFDAASLSPSSLISPGSAHHSEQLSDRLPASSYVTQHSMPASNHIHTRSQSITPSTVSSIQSAPVLSLPHGYSPQSLPATMDQSDDNLSQATLDSLPHSQCSSGVTGNGLDLVSHTQMMGRDGAVLTPRRLEKKPSKRKKLLNMFKKAHKQKGT